MFQTLLHSSEQNSRLTMRWSRRIPSLVRVPLFSAELHKGFVVSYKEKTREYLLHKFDPDTGAIDWETNLVNGGYGSPAVGRTVVAVPTKFTDISGVDIQTGKVRWVFHGKARVRSAVAIDSFGAFIFSAGDTLYRVDESGTVLSEFTKSEHFLYGLPVHVANLFVTMATRTNKAGRSEITIIAFRDDGTEAWQQQCGDGQIISSDTAGICVHEGQIYCCGKNALYCLYTTSGGVAWKSDFDESDIVGRQIPTLSNDYSTIYLASVGGNTYALNSKTGAQKWVFRGNSIANTPVSILGDLVAVSVDGMVHLLDGETGVPFDQIPTGHSPYSSQSVFNGKVYLGGGDPPYHGRLYCFDLVSRELQRSYICNLNGVGANDEAEKFFLQLEVTNTSSEISTVILDASAISEGVSNGATREISPKSRDGNHFVFEVPIRATIVAGLYVVDMYVKLRDGGTVCRTGLVTIDRKTPMPSRVLLSNIQPITQEGALLSGASVMQMVQSYFDIPLTQQSEIRGMVDYITEKSDYEPFNVWRIALRRALSANARSAQELPEYGKENLAVSPDGIE